MTVEIVSVKLVAMLPPMKFGIAAPNSD